MKQVRLFLLLIILFATALVANAQIQTQRGVVRTALRPNKKIVYLQGATIRQRGGHTAVLSEDGGKFEMTMSNAKAGDAFYLSSVRKAGYELADNRTIGRAFTYSSKVPIEIVMINTREKEEDVRRISDNSYRRAEKIYAQRISKLEEQLREKTISEASYREQLQELQTWFEKYESLINSMAERYASTDYATIDSLNAAVNIAIENGELELADSLISTVGSLEKMVKDNKEAERKANERLNLGRDIVKNATADLASIKDDKNRIADLLYSKYSICFTRAENDSAAYYIQMRAELDTTNVDWQNDAGSFMRDYMAKYDIAMNFYQRALNYLLNKYGEIHPDVATVYNYIGGVYNRKGNYKESLSNYQKALEIRLLLFDEKHYLLASCYNNIANSYVHQGAFKEALEYFIKALDIFKYVYGDNNPGVATAYNNIAYVYFKSGKYAEALLNYSKSLNIKLSFYGENNASVATSYNNIGAIYKSQGKYSEALSNYLKALEIRSTIFVNNHPDIASSYNNIGDVYRSLGNYNKSLSNYRKALDMNISILGENHPSVATTYNNIGVVYDDQGLYNEALENYRKALTIRKMILKDNHPDIAVCYSNIGCVYIKTDNYNESLISFQKALDIANINFEEIHPFIATIYNNISSVYVRQHKYSEALSYLRKSLESRRSIFGNNHIELVSNYNNIGGVYKKLGKYDKAIFNYRKALNILILHLGENHPNVASVYGNIGSVYFSQGLYSEALDNISKAIKILKEKYGSDNNLIKPYYIAMYNYYLKAISSSSDFIESYSDFMDNMIFVALVSAHNSPASQKGMSGEYYLLEFADWNHESHINLFDKNNEFRDKPKDIVVMKDGVITKHHFENTIGMQFGLKFVSKEEKQKITEAYHKWKKEQENER